MRHILSKVLIKGFGSNAGWEAAPDRRFTGTAASASSSTKSRVIKSLVEKSSSEKLGPWGNSALVPMMDSALSALYAMVGAGGPRGTGVLWHESRSSHQSVLQDRKLGGSQLRRALSASVGGVWSRVAVGMVETVSITLRGEAPVSSGLMRLAPPLIPLACQPASQPLKDMCSRRSDAQLGDANYFPNQD